MGGGGEQFQDFNEELIRWFEGDVGFGSVNPPSQNERAVMEERLVFVWVVDYVVVDFLGEPRNDRGGSAQLSSEEEAPDRNVGICRLGKKKNIPALTGPGVDSRALSPPVLCQCHRLFYSPLLQGEMLSGLVSSPAIRTSGTYR